MSTIYFAKVNPNAIIPTKREEDAGYDMYPCFDEDYIKIPPHTTKIINLGIATAFDKGYAMLLQERGSTGTKGIAQRCGAIDSGYRGEYMCPVTNTTDKTLYIIKNDYWEQNKNKARFQSAIIYPYEKAICQGVLLPIPKIEQQEISYDQLVSITSERGTGKLGSSGK